MRTRQLEDQLAIERLDEAHVDHGEVEFAANLLGRRHHRAERQQRDARAAAAQLRLADRQRVRSEEHTSELQSLMRISYAVFCLKKKKLITQTIVQYQQHTTTN